MYKFRARDVDEHELIYGNLLLHDNCKNPKEAIIVGENNSGIWRVELNSVSQFIGYDINGNEVYEDDEFVIPVKFMAKRAVCRADLSDHYTYGYVRRLPEGDLVMYNEYDTTYTLIIPGTVSQLIGYDINGRELYKPVNI